MEFEESELYNLTTNQIICILIDESYINKFIFHFVAIDDTLGNRLMVNLKTFRNPNMPYKNLRE